MGTDYSKVLEKVRHRVFIISERCKECGLCIAMCPVKILGKSVSRSSRGYRYPSVLDETKCIGCRLCEYSCPELAIYVL